ncbi:helix-turn-helix domain-containing protein [Thiolapillus sp.]
MAQTRQLIAALKRALKAHGLTYARVAAQLGLSEASIKRLFSRGNFTLQRLEDICRMLDMEISDLAQLAQEEEQKALAGLSLEQEQEIVDDLELLLVAVCVLNRWSFDELLDYFCFGEHRLINLLMRLDRLKMIELLPGNRVKLRVAPNFKWRENGPIQRFFLSRLQQDFFASRFDEDHEKLLVVNGMLADSSLGVFQRRLEQLAREFDSLCENDAGLPFAERNGITVVLAMRRWRYGIFQQYRRDPDQTC